jgi:predicted transcriptional regulator
MGKTTRPGILANLDAEKLDNLNELAARTRIPRSVLMREAVDDLLVKHEPKKPKKPKKRGPKS